MNKFVNSITYGTLGSSGEVGFNVEISGERAEIRDVGNALFAIQHHKRGPSNVVQIGGKFNQENLTNMYTFAEGLRGSGFYMVIIWDGEEWQPWFDGLKDKNAPYRGVIIAETSKPVWLGYEVAMIRYHLTEEGQPELSFPEGYIVPNLSLIIGEKISAKQVLRFIKNAKHRWTIQMETTKDFFELVDYEEQE